MKPTKNQIAEARRQLGALIHERNNCIGDKFNDRDADAIAVLLAATEPPNNASTKEQVDAEAYVAWVRARVLRTSGDVGRAEVAAQEARWAAEQGESGFLAFRSLLDVNVSTAEIASASADLEAERKAHAETKRQCETATARWALSDQVDERWQRATGCSTPEEYTRRAEGEEDENAPAPMTDAEAHADGLCDLGPGGPCNECNRGAAYQTKRLAAVAFGAFSRAKSFGDDDEKAWQYVVTRVLQTYQNDTRAEPTDEQVGQLERMVVHSGASTLRDVIRAVLRSLSAPTLPSEEEIAEEAARFANRYTGEPHQDTDMENALRVMRGMEQDEDPTTLSDWGRCVRAFVETRREKR